MFAFAAARARPFDVLIALLVTLFFTCKAWLEERFLRNEFGTMYDAYRQRVPIVAGWICDRITPGLSGPAHAGRSA